MNKKNAIYLNDLLSARGMTIRLLSRASGVAYATVYNLLTGAKSIGCARADSVKKLADALDLTMDDFYARMLTAERGTPAAPIQDFSLLWTDEVTADVHIAGNDVHIKRYDLCPAKQIFYSDTITTFQLGEIVKTRCWESSRADLDTLLSLISLNEYDPYEIVKRTHGMMAQDHLWFRFQNEKLTYKEVRRLQISA